MTLLLQIFTFLVWLILIPFLVGVIPAFMFEKNKKRIGTVYVAGWFSLTAIFQIMAVPFIIKKSAFSTLELSYSIVVGVVAVISIVVLIVNFGIRTLVDYFEFPSFIKTEKREIASWLFFGLIVFFQIVMSIILMTSDGDDSYYVTHAVIADQHNTMFQEYAYIGMGGSDFDYRHILAPWSMFIAFLARKSNVHATIVAHTILPIVLIPLTYLIFYKISQALFPVEKNKRSMFMILLAIIQMFGASSIYTNEVFFLTRTWQGKSMLANVIIPFAFYLMLQLCRQTEPKEEHRYRVSGIYVLLLLTNIAAALMSSLGTIIVVLFEMIITMLIAFRNKQYMLIGWTFATLIPDFVYIVMYVWG